MGPHSPPLFRRPRRNRNDTNSKNNKYQEQQQQHSRQKLYTIWTQRMKKKRRKSKPSTETSEHRVFMDPRARDHPLVSMPPLVGDNSISGGILFTFSSSFFFSPSLYTALFPPSLYTAFFSYLRAFVLKPRNRSQSASFSSLAFSTFSPVFFEPPFFSAQLPSKRFSRPSHHGGSHVGKTLSSAKRGGGILHSFR